MLNLPEFPKRQIQRQYKWFDYNVYLKGRKPMPAKLRYAAGLAIRSTLDFLLLRWGRYTFVRSLVKGVRSLRRRNGPRLKNVAPGTLDVGDAEVILPDGSIYAATVGSAGSDLLTTAAGVDIHDAAELQFQIDGEHPFLHGIYTLISTGDGGLVGSFGEAEGQVPEPGVLLLLAGGLLGIATRRWWRRRQTS